LFEVIRLGDGFVACKGGTGTLAELAVTWEMMNKSVMPAKPFVALGEFWSPILQCVREVEAGQENPWAEAQAQILKTAATPKEAAEFLWNSLEKEM
jgi:predicted Rossmann-fold nucleotide-binding protein